MKGLSEEAIKAAVRSGRGRRYPGVKCQGKGGICPNLATHKTDRVPGVYCDICTIEVDRVISVMRSYVEEHNLIDQEAIIKVLEAKGFKAHKTPQFSNTSKKKLKTEQKARERMNRR
jgi:hypothetical protein